VDVRECVAIIGSGLIGRAWAVVFAGGGCDVALYDAGAGVAEKARSLVSEGLDELAAVGPLSEALTELSSHVGCRNFLLSIRSIGVGE